MKLRVLVGIYLCLLSTYVAALNSHSISYMDVGEGPSIILIPPFPTDKTLWKPQQDELKKDFRIITLDLPGFGQAMPTDGNAVTMEEYADEVKHLLHQLHIKKAIIGGESMGGYVALAFLKKYPEAVNGLILSDTQAIADSVENKNKREESARDVLENGPSHFIDNFMIKAVSMNASNEIKSFLKNIVSVQSAHGIASALRGMALREDTSNVLASTSVPILIITGDQDAVIPSQQSMNMYDLAKNSKLVVIKNAGHLSSLENPDEWNFAVKKMFPPY